MKHLNKAYSLVHILAWMVFSSLPFLFPGARASMEPHGLIQWYMNVVFNAAVFYFFYAFLNKRYLKQKTLWQFMLGAIVAIFIFAVLRYALTWLAIQIGFEHALKDFWVYILSTVLINTFFAGLALFVNFTEAWFRNQKMKQELENERLQSELKMLRFQVNPHFLFNTLNNIYTLVYKKADAAPEAVLKLSSLMRYMLYEADAERVPLQKELNYISHFIELQKLRLASHHEVSFSINGEPENHKIAPLLLIPFIENAFKHSASASKKSNVSIQLSISKDTLTFICKNDFNNQKPSSLHSGVGLKNAQKRLQLIYPNKHTLNIASENTPFTVQLTINW